ncbi:hypothetical protein MLD38_010732 [Melastoma candidum]|uniref:Uncharacterized protein n=1 Tax=Melastoma candidum TaxID=119954 RepID=A0ACB9R242_9MYRT|nr:hypothetical protein MLD38_010732 [Melastoma candidum]
MILRAPRRARLQDSFETGLKQGTDLVMRDLLMLWAVLVLITAALQADGEEQDLRRANQRLIDGKTGTYAMVPKDGTVSPTTKTITSQRPTDENPSQGSFGDDQENNLPKHHYPARGSTPSRGHGWRP